MKMNRQNPGGECASYPTMKGCEKYMARGKGDIKPYTASGLTKGTLAAHGLSGMAKKGHADNSKYDGRHSITSFSGKNPTATGKGLR